MIVFKVIDSKKEKVLHNDDYLYICCSTLLSGQSVYRHPLGVHRGLM